MTAADIDGMGCCGASRHEDADIENSFAVNCAAVGGMTANLRVTGYA